MQENKNLKNIPNALIKFIDKILFGNVDSLEKAQNEYDNLLNRHDEKKLLTPKRTVTESNTNKMRTSFDDLEYIIFGSYTEYKKELQKSKKLDIATDGEDMSELETEEEAEKIMSTRAK